MRDALRRLRRKFAYSFLGFWTVLKEEKSIWMQLAFVPIIIGFGIWVKLSSVEWSIVTLVMFLNLIIETINTALEAAVDTIMFQYNVKVKKIKDIASGATMLMTLATIVILLIIFIPAIQEVV